MNTETAQVILEAKAKALRDEADAIDLAVSILKGKYEGELVSLPALVEDNAVKAAAIETYKTTVDNLTSEKASLITEKEGLESTVAIKEAKIAELTPLVDITKIVK